MREIAILGAFDRHNYGDLLFPIIIEKYIKDYRSNLMDEYRINFYGLIKSDLSYYGAKPTKGIKELLNGTLSYGSIIIIAGGEVLTGRWSSMFEFLSTNKFKYYLRKAIRKIIGVKNFDRIIMKLLGGKTLFPWVISKEDFQQKISVFYNAVGGSDRTSINESELTYIKNKLSNSDFISVRDCKTLLNFQIPGIKLTPDSAIIMSHFFSLSYLETMISFQTINIINNINKEFICFQINLSSAKRNESKIARELEKISKKYKCKIILLPIGTAAGHDDHIALSNIQKCLTITSILPKRINIYDIIYLIARSKAFIGTSLHGNITAISYAIPHIGINKNIKKLDAFLKTWDLEQQNSCVDFEEMFNKFEEVISIPKEALNSKRDELVHLVLENFDQMFNNIT